MAHAHRCRASACGTSSHASWRLAKDSEAQPTAITPKTCATPSTLLLHRPRRDLDATAAIHR